MKTSRKRMTRAQACDEARRRGLEIKSTPEGGIWKWANLRQEALFIPDHAYTKDGVLVVQDRSDEARG